jgi:hypothetical protein
MPTIAAGSQLIRCFKKRVGSKRRLPPLTSCLMLGGHRQVLQGLKTDPVALLIVGSLWVYVMSAFLRDRTP